MQLNHHESCLGILCRRPLCPVKNEVPLNDMQGGSRAARKIVSCAQPPHHSLVLHDKPRKFVGTKSCNGWYISFMLPVYDSAENPSNHRQV